MRKTWIVLLVAVSIILVGLVGLWLTFDVNDYRQPIEAQLENRLGREVTLGPMDLALFPPHFEASDVVISDDPEFENPKPFIAAERVGVSVKLLPLFRGDVEITSLDLHRPVIELIKNQKGVWNFSSLRPVAADQEVARQPAQAEAFSLGTLSVEDGQVALTDREAEQPRAVYTNIDLTLKDLAPDTPFSARVGIQLPGEGTQEVSLQGQGGPIPPGNLAATPFQGTLELKEVRLAGLRQFLGKEVLSNMDGTVTGQTEIDIQSGTAAAEGEMRIDDAVIQKLDLGYPITANYSVSNDLRESVLLIKKGALQLGSTRLSLNGTLDLKSSPVQLGLKVKTDNMSLAEVSRLAPAFGMPFPQNTEVKGELDGEFQVKGTTDKPALDGALAANSVQISGTDIPQPLEIQAVTFQLSPAAIESNEFDVKSGETTIRSRVALRAYASPKPVLDARLDAPSAQFSAIVALAKAYGVTALDHLTGDGTLSIDLRLAGPVRSLTGDSILRALNGQTTVAFDNLRVSSTNMSREIATVAGFLKRTGPGQSFTSISKMTGKISIRNGVAQTDDLKATLDLGRIAVQGSADLATQALNLRVNAVVNQQVSQEAGGTGIRGYLQTALANDQGELVVPVRVTGTFEDPKVSPDLQAVAEMKLKQVLPTSGNPAAGLPGVIGDILGRTSEDKEQQSETPPSEESPAKSTVERILEGLSGGQQQKKQEDKPKSGE